MKLLNGRDLVGYIKERQAGQAQALIQGKKIRPRLAIICTIDDPVTALYLKLKKAYGEEIEASVDYYQIKQVDILQTIDKLNQDASVHGIIIQLPLQDSTNQQTILNAVAPEKDVDGLGEKSLFEPATPLAILWLLNGYNVELQGKEILIVGQGTLVGAPLTKMLQNSGLNVKTADIKTKDLGALTITADVIVTATGVPSLITRKMLKKDAVVVDAGVASENGKTVGDLDPRVYERQDLTITPQKGGVGPLTVAALFENLLRAAGTSSS